MLAACGGDDGSGSDGDTQDPAALEGESWILTQMLTAGGQTEIVDVGVSASFDGTTIPALTRNIKSKTGPANVTRSFFVALSDIRY